MSTILCDKKYCIIIYSVLQYIRGSGGEAFVQGYIAKQLPPGHHVAGAPVTAGDGGYVRLSDGAGNRADQRRAADLAGGVAVPRAVPFAGTGPRVGKPGAGGETNDAELLSP